MLEVVTPLQVNVYAMMADMTWIAQVILIVHPKTFGKIETVNKAFLF